MSIAALSAQQLSLTSRQSDYELQITILSSRQQRLMLESASVTEDYLLKIQAAQDEEGEDDTVDIDFDNDAFYLEYEAASTKISIRDQALELEKENLESQQSAITTSLESVKKTLQTNIGKEFNTSMG